MSYYVRTAAEIAPAASEQYAAHAAGHRRDELVGQHVGSVHTGFALNELAAGGHIDPHVHSCEESFYVLSGNPTLVLDGRAHRLAPDECGLIPLGSTHSWRVAGGETARWLEVTAPAPRRAGAPDTFFTGEDAPADEGEPLDIRDPRSRTFFRLDPGQMELENRKLGAPVDAPTVSASMATALLAYSGITLQMLVDQRLGAVLHTMFMVQYEPGGVAQPHDHPLEETYYILEGEVEALADGETIVLRAGDVFWTSVGCVHAFYNRSATGRVRWLETQSPQPPSNHSYRFDRDWDYLAARLPEGGQLMRAAVTTGPNAMRVADVAEPARPGAGELLVRPEAVGLCGSDFHYFHGHLGGAFPRIQGHEFSAIVEEAGARLSPASPPASASPCGR